MKIIYSYLQKFLPDLNIEPQKLRDDLTMIGHFCNYYEKIDNELVFDLDIKVNRGDCYGYYGIALDLATYYELELITPQIDLPTTRYKLPIQITSKDVRRVMCLKISKLQVAPSPQWLADFIKIHQINTVNNIVDLTNYIMFLYGIPNHAFDIAKTGEEIIWENNQGKSKTFTTLDGTVLKLTPENLVLSNPSTVISTDFVGGKDSGTYENTKDIIIEVAVYDPNRVRTDAKQHKTITEAGIRLEKQLDPNLIPQAIKHLAKLIIDLAKGQVTSDIYDYYPIPETSPKIQYDYNLASTLSGITITKDFSDKIFNKLGCQIDNYGITPPTIRKDITIPEDLAEEVIRFYGYQNIPSNEPLKMKNTPNITPTIIKYIDYLKDQLTSLGYDEILSWPLVATPKNNDTVVKTQNSVNTDFPYLRQNITQSLLIQLDSYQRLKLPHPQFFEIGKTFQKIDNQYLEYYALGIYHYSTDKLESDLKKLGLSASVKDSMAEIILDEQKVVEYSFTTPTSSAYELTSQIITLDANVTENQQTDPEILINHYKNLIDPNIFWSIIITDIYKNKYTFRVSYFNCDDKTAKKAHLKAFNLE